MLNINYIHDTNHDALKLDSNQDTCGDGYRQIVTSTQCQEAAAQLHSTTTYLGLDSSSSKGCYYDSSHGGSVILGSNIDVTPSVTMSPLCISESICVFAKQPTGSGALSCPATQCGPDVSVR